MQSSTIFGNIQFHGIKTIYPIGEAVQCFFTVPEVSKPVSGDWIGIYPVGWTSIVRDCVVRQMVPVEQFIAGGQYGQVEFELMTHQFVPQQQYQFVYVNNNGECTILGKSMPFRFVLTSEQTGVFGGRYATPMVGGEWTGRFPTSIETEMHKLQADLMNLEQVYTGEWTTGRIPSTLMNTTSVIGGRIAKNVEQIWFEKIRVEQAQRRIEQLSVLAQLKSCERHIMSVLKREPEICNFLLKNKLQTKIAAFEQKVQQVIATKMNLTTPVEQYVRKYEQLLKEKIQLDIQKRMLVLQKMRLTIRDCERRLRELQTIDQEHVGLWQQTLKTKFEQILRTENHFETVMGPFWFEQEKNALNLIQTQREVTYIINEICTRLQEFEVVECYTQLRIPRIISSLMFNSHPKLMQIVQLERKIAEQKMKLKIQMLTQAGLMTGNGSGLVEQITRGIWFTPVVEKLQIIKSHLKQWCLPQMQQHHRFWVENKLQSIVQLINMLTQFEVVGQSTVFDQVKLRNVLVQLRELKERDCIEIPRFFKQEQIIGGPFSPIVFGELCQHLNEIVGEKIVQLNKYMQCFEPQFYQMQQQLPLECLFVTVGMQQQWHQKFLTSMLELVEIERKLVEMKSVALTTFHYNHLDERCVELEKWMRGCTGQQWSTIFEQQPFGKRFAEKLRQVKGLIGEHIEVFPTYTTGLMFPEQLFQHQQKYEKLCQLVGELECHFVELPMIHSGIYTPQIPFVGGEYKTYGQIPFVGGEYKTNGQIPFVGGEYKTYGQIPQEVHFVYQQLIKLIQEFQIQFPECFAPKCEEIVSFLRQCTVRMPSFELLREKLVEFETILCQPECEIACLTTVVFPQSTTATFKTQRETLRFLIRQVRELKTQLIQLTNTDNTWFSEPTPFGFENNLVNMWNKKMWTGENVLSNTQTYETLGQQYTGIYRPSTFEQMVGGEQFPTMPLINKFSRQFGSQFEINHETEFGLEGCEINNNEWEFVAGGENIDSFLYQIEKNIRRFNGNGLLVETEQPEIYSFVDTNTTGLRRF